MNETIIIVRPIKSARVIFTATIFTVDSLILSLILFLEKCISISPIF